MTVTMCAATVMARNITFESFNCTVKMCGPDENEVNKSYTINKVNTFWQNVAKRAEKR